MVNRDNRGRIRTSTSMDTWCVHARACGLDRVGAGKWVSFLSLGPLYTQTKERVSIGKSQSKQATFVCIHLFQRCIVLAKACVIQVVVVYGRLQRWDCSEV